MNDCLLAAFQGECIFAKQPHFIRGLKILIITYRIINELLYYVNGILNIFKKNLPTINANRYVDIIGVRAKVTAFRFPCNGSSYKICYRRR